jgi:hypothetical protein
MNVISSKRNVGKSFLCRYLVSLMANDHMFDYIKVFSTTDRYNHFWSDTVGSENVIYGFDDDVLKILVKYQENELAKYHKNHKYKPKRGLYIFDDVIGGSDDGNNKKMNNSNTLEFIFTSGRHIFITCFFCLQYSKIFLIPLYRNNIDYLFLSTNSDEALTGFYGLASSSNKVNNFKDFKKLVRENTNDYYFLLLDNFTKDKNKMFKKIKAKDTEGLKLHFK